MTKYAIIDVETTGGQSGGADRITEIAIVIHNGVHIVEQYSTLLNPERSIPPGITALTGISDAMVRTAPKFYEVAKKIVELTEGAIFVAHNVAFDYGFVQNEFRRLGFHFQRKRLCTVRLSRKLLPGKPSYSLGRLTASLGISLQGAHRALNDTLATTKLFELLLQTDTADEIEAMLNYGVVATRLPQGITMAMLENLPESTGVYYFYNDYKDVIYVGKSINIRKRVMEHIANKKQAAQRMMSVVTDITWEETGSELLALLHESEEIKTVQPAYNKAQKPKVAPYALFSYTDENGYLRLAAAKTPKKVAIVSHFTTYPMATAAITNLLHRFGLCANLCTVLPSANYCFKYQLGSCKGACGGKEHPQTYNERVAQAIQTFATNDKFVEDCFLVEEGRDPNELAIVLLQNKVYVGFGYIEKDAAAHEWFDAIQPKQHTADAAQIIKDYINTHKTVRKIKL
jgi:DNA polymerase III subunit epsilon